MWLFGWVELEILAWLGLKLAIKLITHSKNSVESDEIPGLPTTILYGRLLPVLQKEARDSAVCGLNNSFTFPFVIFHPK